MAGLIDRHNRQINYLRISITDRCNLRCRYCMPSEGTTKFDHADILRYEEILRLAALAVKKGISKIRITGGEPLVRKGVVEFIKSLSHLSGIQDLSLTTNGILLKEFALPLFQAGLKRINVSMDSLDPQKYREITRGGELSCVWSGIEAAHFVGIFPIKINVVGISGFNDTELLSFAELTLKKKVQVRFIEFMPIGSFDLWSPEQCITSAEMKRRIETIRPLIFLEESKNGFNGPARLYKFPEALGEIGFISPISDHFCNSCNRLRLTADGKLKTCLFSNEEIDIRRLLRSGANDEELGKKLEEAILTKPLRHGGNGAVMKRCQRPMAKIGG
jgi:GTP 3',8-cyclase